MANVAYILATAGTGDASDQRKIIEAFASGKNLRIDNYITVDIPPGRRERNRMVQELFSHVNRWDTIVVSDLARLGHSIADIVNLLKGFMERGVRFAAAFQGIDINGPGDETTKAAAAVFSMLADMESAYVSERIREALALKKKEGAVLGRPRGSISPSKLDDRKEMIIEYLAKGVSKTSLARILGTSPSNLLSYLRSRKITTGRQNVVRPAGKEDSAVRPAVAGQGTVPAGVKSDRAPGTGPSDDAGDIILCRHCGKNVLDPRTTTCAGGYIDYEDGESFHRVPYPDNEKGRCPKCFVSPGGFHHDGCYMERCPRCGERLVSCACRKR